MAFWLTKLGVGWRYVARRCLQDVRTCDPVYEGEHGGHYLAVAIDDGTDLLATVTLRDRLTTTVLQLFQAAIESFKAIGAAPFAATQLTMVVYSSRDHQVNHSQSFWQNGAL